MISNEIKKFQNINTILNVISGEESIIEQPEMDDGNEDNEICKDCDDTLDNFSIISILLFLLVILIHAQIHTYAHSNVPTYISLNYAGDVIYISQRMK